MLTFSSNVYVFNINDCDILPMHRKKSIANHFCHNSRLLLKSFWSHVEKSLLASVCKLSCINFLMGFKMCSKLFQTSFGCLKLHSILWLKVSQLSKPQVTEFGTSSCTGNITAVAHTYEFLFIVIMSPHFRVGRHIVLPGSPGSLSVHLSVHHKIMSTL